MFLLTVTLLLCYSTPPQVLTVTDGVRAFTAVESRVVSGLTFHGDHTVLTTANQLGERTINLITYFNRTTKILHELCYCIIIMIYLIYDYMKSSLPL